MRTPALSRLSLLGLGLLFLALTACGKDSPTGPASGGNPPDMPTGLVATAQPGRVTLVWNPVPNAAGYVVYWDSVGSVDALDTEIPSDRPGLFHTGLANGTTYSYRVAAVNGDGSSLLCPQVSATPSGAAAFRMIVCGANNSFAVMSDGLVYAWGDNAFGQLGMGSFQAQHRPALVPGLGNVTQLDASGDHTIAVQESGRAFSWGRNDGGQLGTGDNQLMWSPTPVDGPLDFVSVAAGKDHSMGLTSANQVWIWGVNFSGVLGLGHADAQYRPAAVPGLGANGGFVVAGSRTSFYKTGNATGVSNALYSWGENGFGQLGRGDPSEPYQYGSVSGAATITALSTSFQHTVAIRDGFAITWGWGAFGQLGNGTTSGSGSPVGVKLSEQVIAVSAGLTQSLALTVAGQVYIWGDGSIYPAPVPGQSGVVMIASGRAHNLALKLDGTLWAWGNNSWGQLGDGTTLSRDTPVRVSGF